MLVETTYLTQVEFRLQIKLLFFKQRNEFSYFLPKRLSIYKDITNSTAFLFYSTFQA